MTWYKTGTVAVTSGSNAVIGTGTAFIANARVGDAFRGPDGQWYEVTNIASNTALSIAPNYQGPTVAAGAYSLAPMQGYVKDSADALRAAAKVIAGGATDMQEQVIAATEAAQSAGQSKALATEQAGIASSAATLSTQNKAASEAAASTAVAARDLAVSSKNSAAISATNAAKSAQDAAASAGRSIVTSGSLDSLITPGGYTINPSSGNALPGSPPNTTGSFRTYGYLSVDAGTFNTTPYIRQTWLNGANAASTVRWKVSTNAWSSWVDFMSVGDFGLGLSTDSVTVADCNNAKTSGKYRISATGTANAPVAVFGTIEVSIWDNVNITQTVVSLDGRVWVRALSAGNWLPWVTVTLPNMVGATAAENGVRGAVPAPASGNRLQFLRGDGGWGYPTWGFITGTIAQQGDLITLLNAKLDTTSADFTIIYPNGGSATSPANIVNNTRYISDNPFAGSHVVVVLELLMNGSWSDPGWDGNTGSGSATYGSTASQILPSDKIITQTGTGGVATSSNLTGGGHGASFSTSPTTAPCRVKVWKLKGAIT